MKFVNVDRTVLLEKMKANRELHVTEFNEALVGYKDQVKQRLEQIVSKVNSDDFSDLHVSLPPPQSHEGDYDKVIAMLEMTIDSTISLSDIEFQQYVLDEWNWKSLVKSIHANYSGSR